MGVSVLGAVLVPGLLQASAQSTSRAVAMARARAAATALLQLYDRDTGLFRTTGWWNSANAITALADLARVTGDHSYSDTFRNTFLQAPRKFASFQNEFYDDEGWWALAWIDVYDLAPHARDSQRYLQTAEAIFTDMTGGWDDTCGGGIWWKKDRHYKNAIANELFLAVAAKLAQHTRGTQRAAYTEWAHREWTWFSQTGMINADGLVNDGLDSACRNNGRTTWSYNQGVVLGGLTALHRVDRNPALVPAADSIANAAMTHLADAQGVLHDPCEPSCGEDGVQFKGIFARNLAEMVRARHLASLQGVTQTATSLQFLQVNAESLWSKARTPEDRFNVVWSGPAEAGNAGAQSSALDALTAAAVVTR